MKKKISLVMAAVVTAMSLAACGGSQTAETTKAAATEAAKTEAAAPAQTEAAASGEVAWPEKAITVNVAAKAGGGTDLQTRYITTAWQKTVGEAVAVVNYDNAQVAMETVRTAKPDGYNLLTHHSGCLCQYQVGASEINPVEDYEVVAAMQFMGDQAFIVSPDAPFNTMAEMVEYAKANPGKLSLAIANGSASHFIFGAIVNETGIDVKMVEAANETEKLTNIAGGFIDCANVTIQNAVQYVEGGKVKVIGVVSKNAENDPALQDYEGCWETLQSQGIDVAWGSNVYVWAPKGTDPAVVEAINASLKPVIDDPDYLEGCKNMGATPEWHSVEESRKMLEEEQKMVAEVATALGLNVR